MSSTDPRLQYITQLASTALDLDQNTKFETWPGQVQKSVIDFVNDFSKESLRLCKTEEGLRTAPDISNEAVYFLKRYPGSEIPIHNVNRYILSTTFQGEQELQLLLQHLRRDDGPISDHTIITIKDEIRFWQGQKQLPAAGLYISHLEALDDRLSTKWQSENDIRSCLEDVEMIIGDLWREGDGSYPQSRMLAVIQACSTRLVSYIQESLSDLNIFYGPWQTVRQYLTRSQRIIDLWQLILHDLYQRDFIDRWQGEWIDDDLLNRVSRRLRHLTECRGLHEELKRLIPKSDHGRLGLDIVLQSLAESNPLHWSPFSDESWTKSLTRFDRDVNPIEHHGNMLLKQRLQSISSNPTLILAELDQFPELLSRPLAGEDLANERDHLLTVMLAFVDHLRNQFESSSEQNISFLCPNLTPIVSRIIWSSQISTRCRQARDVVDRVLYGVQGLERFITQCDQILEQIQLFCQNQFQSWLDAINTELASPSSSLRLQATGHLVDFDLENDGDMRVHYDERLLTLMRDVRVLSEFGYRMTSEIDSIVTSGDQFYRYAVQLQQVAHFYNTMSDQIIPSQKAMLLPDAQAFEKAVQNASATWNNVQQMSDYVSGVMQAADRLTSRNRRLRVVHEAIGNEVRTMIATDLTGSAWNQIMNRIVGKISIQERQYGDNGVQMWRRHWDQQIYKVLRSAYGRMLSSWAPIRVTCQLVVEMGQICFDPGLEEIRLTLTRNVKKLIHIPVNMLCLDPSQESRRLFASIPAQFNDDICRLFMNIESLCKEMKQVSARYRVNAIWLLEYCVLIGIQNWIAPALIDVRAFIAEHFGRGSSLELGQALADIDMKMMEVNNIEDQIDLSLVSISLISLKQSIRRIGGDLIQSIHHHIRDLIHAELFQCDQFIQQCQAVIGSRPKTSSEIMAARQALLQLLQTKSELISFDRLDELNQLLAGSEHGIDLGPVRQRWSGLDQDLGTFEDILQNCSDYCRKAILTRTKALNSNIEKFASRWKALRPTQGSVQDHETTLNELNDWQRDLDHLRHEIDDLKAESQTFNLDPPDIVLDLFQTISSDLVQIQSVWNMIHEFQMEYRRLADDEPWIELRSHAGDIGEFLHQWTEKLKVVKTEMQVVLELHVDLRHLEQVYSQIRYLTGDYFQKDHWSTMIHILHLPGNINLQSLRLRHLLQVADHIQTKAQSLRDLNSRAQGEVTLREAFDEIRSWSETCEFDLIVESDQILVKGWDQIQSEIGDKLSLLSSLRDSPYFTLFQDQALHLQSRFQLLDGAITKLSTIQRRWVYLAPIFNRGALPKEQARFERIDQEFRSIMTAIKTNRNVVSLSNMKGLEDRLTTMVEQLERCQKALSEFLEQKRSQFSRFYFIGDDALLEILGQSSSPTVVQAHLKKLFQGIDRVEFDRESIVAMVSAENETVQLLEPIDFTCDVDQWMSNLCHQMKSTLQHLLVEAMKQPRLELQRYPAQILCLANEIQFTNRVELALDHNGTQLSNIEQDIQKRLSELTCDHGDRLWNIKAKSLIVDLVHQLDLIKMLSKNQVRSRTDWLWQKQLRFYLNDQGRCQIKQSSAELVYSYEYQGNASRLVHTELTDKCYLVLTTGIHLGYGGNPYGPAGTGKTESVKALGQALGRQVLVFNCDDGIDAQSMSRIFTGLVKSGAWGCFDEFNRLRQDQLSAISQQIQLIQSALKSGPGTVRLLDTPVNVHPDSGIFVTMNPAGKEYGGRSRLPDNLKALFRPVAMTAPDFDLIAQVIMYSCGFNHGHELGPKLVSIFDLGRQLLSNQKHYDWGLRSFKSVLNTAARLLGQHDIARTIQNEAEVLVRALSSNMISKITRADLSRFQSLMQDIFPNVQMELSSNVSLHDAVLQTYKQLNLKAIPEQIDKIMQLDAALAERMGVVVFGHSGTGKSTLLRVLAGARLAQCQPVRMHVINPKAIDRHQLFGYMDPDTRQWTDGVLTHASRQVLESDINYQHWIVCDGDVDPEWIESLNSVLDDNHLLTLPNGERLQFRSNVNFIFETDDLQYASPATISRMGMVFVGTDHCDLISALVSTCRHKIQSEITQDLIDSVLIPLLRYGQENNLINPVLETNNLSMVCSIFSHISNCTSRHAFTIGLIRALSANLRLEHLQPLFSELVRLAQLKGIDPSACLDLYYDRDSESLRPFQMANSEERPKGAGDNTLVETVQVQRYVSIMEPWVCNREPILLIGPEGAGKSTLIELLMRKTNMKSSAELHCSAHTRPEHIIDALLNSCQLTQSSTGPVLRPNGADQFVLIVKDLGLLCRDKYGSLSVICFLTQLLECSGYYSSDREFVAIEHINIICTMTRSETAATLSTRFTSRLRILNIDYPSEYYLRVIYEIYLGDAVNVAKEFDAGLWSHSSSCSALSHTLVQLYLQISQTFTSDQYPHYRFTPRHLTAFCKSLLQYDLKHEPLLNIFVYELQRTFRDRLVTEQCRARFDSILTSVMNSHWKMWQPSSAGKHIYSSLLRSVSDQSFSLLSISDAKSCLSNGIRRYEQDHGNLDLDLFDNMIQFCCRIDQAICQKSRSVLLLGSSGIGRRSVIVLVSHIRSYRLFMPNISRAYSADSLQNDLKDVFRQCAAGDQVVLYLEQHGLVQDSIISILCTVLSSGYLPGLFSQPELEPILGSLREKAADIGINTMQYFFNQIRSNLHLVICMDPAHPQFKSRCLQYPVLIHSCHIIWNTEWHRDDVMFMTQNRLQLGFLENDVKSITDRLLKIYDWAASCQHTPRKFLAMLATYCRLYSQQQDKIQSKRKYLSMGLSKLVEAEMLVDKLSSEAVAKSGALQDKQIQADAALQSITDSMSKASDRRLEVQALQASLSEKEQRLTSRKGQVEKELAVISPILEQSREAVGSIKKEALAEMRALRMPPEAVHDVLSGVLMLMGIDDTSWNSMKRLLASATFKEEIIQFDAHCITKDIRDKVQSLLKKKEASFEHKNIYRVNTAAAPLAAWVHAQIRYAQVLESIAPLEADLKAANEALASSKSRLDSCVNELQDLDKQVMALKQSFAGMTSEAASLRLELDRAQNVLDRASQLMNKLQDEKVRWRREDDELSLSLNRLSDQVIISSAFICYLADQDEEYRRQILQRWSEVYRLQEQFDLCRFLSTESEIITWKEHGINSDRFSLENAVTILASQQTPFIIDSTMNVVKWLQRMQQKRSLEFLNQNDARYLAVIELAVRFGKVLFITDCNHVESTLYPIITRHLLRQGPRWVVQIADKSVDYNDDFSLFLISRSENCHLPADARAIVNVVNFTVTKSGLESQLLGVAIQQDEPELERNKIRLLAEEENMKLELSELEKKILETLATSEGNILENVALVESLNLIKTRSNSIAIGLQRSAEIQADLDRQRLIYMPIAQIGSEIYFTLRLLPHVNSMYRFSLQSFMTEFVLNFQQSSATPSTSDKANRITFYCRSLISRLYRFVSQSVFKQDRLTLAMQLCRALFPDQCADDLWSLLIGSITSTKSESITLPSWVPSERQSQLLNIIASQPSLHQLIHEDIGAWIKWLKSPSCESQLLPPSCRSLSCFHRLILIMALRPDRLISAMTEFVCQALQIASLSPTPLSIQELTNSTSSSIPILFIISPGVDPSRDVQECAKSKGVELLEIGMSPEQRSIAIDSIHKAASTGLWVCLKNIHLVAEWLPILEQTLSSISQYHQEYRLWLIAESQSDLSPILLEMSLKLTIESPPGIKRNLLTTYSMWNIDYISRGSAQRARVLFILAWFHAVIQERRLFIPQGWSKFYEFSLSDLRSASDLIDEICSESDRIAWPRIVGVLQDSIYGGRIDNPYDDLVLQTYLHEYFTDDSDKRLGLPSSCQIPHTNNHADFIKLIRSLPEQDSPSVFGLPDNIDASVQRQTGSMILSQLKQLHHITVLSNHDLFDAGRWGELLSPLFDLQSKYERGRLSQSSVDVPDKHYNPTTAFLIVEDQKATDLINLINHCLNDLRQVLSGSAILSQTLLEHGRDLIRGQVLKSWLLIWNTGPDDAHQFISDVFSKKSALATWLKKSFSGTLLSSTLSLRDLFNPITFLNAFRQETARIKSQPIDTLRLNCVWEKSRLPSDATMVLQLQGLLLQGGELVGGQISRSASQSASLMPLPICYITFNQMTETTQSYQSMVVPLYSNLSRSVAVCQLRLPCSNNKHQWILAGVAIFLSDS